MEQIGVILLATGAVLAIVASIWLFLNAFRVHWLWAVGFIIPLVPLIFCFVHFRKARWPLLLAIFAAILIAVPFVISDIDTMYAQWYGTQKKIDGETYVNLTGWKGKDYEKIDPETAVLEMGNPNVDDEQVRRLTDLPNLKELTLSKSSITDASFEAFRAMPKLEKLRIAETKITKEGLERFLQNPPETLKMLDVSRNNIPREVLEEWKSKAPKDRRFLN